MADIWDISAAFHEKLVEACDDHLLDEVKRLVDEINLQKDLLRHVFMTEDEEDEYGRTIIFNLCNSDDKMDCLKFLHENGLCLEDHDWLHVTPLMVAAEKGCLEVVKYLLDNCSYNADDSDGNVFEYINDFDQWGCTALMLAADNGHPEVVKFLVQKGATVNEKFWHEGSLTALELAENKSVKYLEIINFLKGLDNN